MPKLVTIGSFPGLPSAVQVALRTLEDNVKRAVDALSYEKRNTWRVYAIGEGVFRASVGDMIISTLVTTPNTQIILPQPTPAILGEEVVVVREAGNPTIYASNSLINGATSWVIPYLRAERFVAGMNGWVTYG